MEPGDEVLPVTISGMQDKLPRIPTFWRENIIKELRGKDKQPEKA